MFKSILLGLAVGLTGVTVLRQAQPQDQVITFISQTKAVSEQWQARWRPVEGDWDLASDKLHEVKLAPNYKDVPFVEFLESLERLAGIEIHCKWDELNGLRPDTPITFATGERTALEALESVLATYAYEGGYRAEETTITLGSFSPEPVVRVYDVRDLILYSMDLDERLERVNRARAARKGSEAPIRDHPFLQNTTVEQWTIDLLQDALLVGRFHGTHCYWAGRIIIEIEPDQHARIAKVLAELRKAPVQ